MTNTPQLRQVFHNLIWNAIKFRSVEAPAIHVSATRQGKEWIFSVSDNGIGISAEHRETVFAIFQRLHTREEYAGNGIGLAICKKVIERHGGRIWAESPPEGGTIFKFTLRAPEGELDETAVRNLH
jgi:light-regulated signal transduction histidine kinase (bacteriophytochrome)